MSLKGTFGPLVDRLREPNGKIALRWRWSGIAILALFCVVAIIGGAFWSIIALIGLVAAIVGIYAAVTGSAKSFRVRSRSAGAVMLGAGLLVMLVGTGVNAVTRPQTPDSASVAKSASGSVQVDEVVKPSPTPTPVKTESEVQLVAAIPFEVTSVEDPNIDVGASAITTAGANGETTTTYLVKSVDGVEVSREVRREEVTLQPISEVTSVGSRQPAPPAPDPIEPCNSNYADVCVPNSSDVDCEGGSGDGPAYVDGPLRIVGTDVYGLDRDGDGIACDK